MSSRYLSVLLLALPLSAQTANETRKQLEYTRAHYTKYDYRIPMRDGVRLYTSVYAPKDTSHPYPILMTRTPYSVGPYGIDNYRAVVGPSELAEKEGFIIVYQDVRGRYMSEGTFVDIPPHKTHFNGPKDFDESTDTWDTIDWLVKNVSNNNGKVGIWGISYPGFFAAFGLMNAHPALKGFAAGAHGRRGQRRRRLSQRRLPPGGEFRLLQQLQAARRRTRAAAEYAAV